MFSINPKLIAASAVIAAVVSMAPVAIAQMRHQAPRCIDSRDQHAADGVRNSAINLQQVAL
jgi:hypothetical protein